MRRWICFVILLTCMSPRKAVEAKKPATKPPAAKKPTATKKAATKKPKSVSPPEHRYSHAVVTTAQIVLHVLPMISALMRVACTSEGEAKDGETEGVAQSPATRLLQVPPHCRLHPELLVRSRRSTVFTVLTLHRVGHTCKDHSRRLQSPVLSPVRTTLIVTTSLVSPKKWADAGVCITFGPLQVDKRGAPKKWADAGVCSTFEALQVDTCRTLVREHLGFARLRGRSHDICFKRRFQKRAVTTAHLHVCAHVSSNPACAFGTVYRRRYNRALRSMVS